MPPGDLLFRLEPAVALLGQPTADTPAMSIVMRITPHFLAGCTCIENDSERGLQTADHAIFPTQEMM